MSTPFSSKVGVNVSTIGFFRSKLWSGRLGIRTENIRHYGDDTVGLSPCTPVEDRVVCRILVLFIQGTVESINGW